MTKLTKDNLFQQPTLSKGEAKSAATARIAQAAIDLEVAQRQAKTDRLRLARLAKEAAEAELVPVKAPKPRPTTRRAG